MRHAYCTNPHLAPKKGRCQFWDLDNTCENWLHCLQITAFVRGGETVQPGLSTGCCLKHAFEICYSFHTHILKKPFQRILQACAHKSKIRRPPVSPLDLSRSSRVSALDLHSSRPGISSLFFAALPPPARYTIPVIPFSDVCAFDVFDRPLHRFSYLAPLQTFMNALKHSSTNFNVEWVKYAQSSKVNSSQVKQDAIFSRVATFFNSCGKYRFHLFRLCSLGGPNLNYYALVTHDRKAHNSGWQCAKFPETLVAG